MVRYLDLEAAYAAEAAIATQSCAILCQIGKKDRGGFKIPGSLP